MQTELVVMKLELIAAKAKLLAHNVSQGHTCAGDIRNGAGEITTLGREVFDEARNDR